MKLSLDSSGENLTLFYLKEIDQQYLSNLWYLH